MDNMDGWEKKKKITRIELRIQEESNINRNKTKMEIDSEEKYRGKTGHLNKIKVKEMKTNLQKFIQSLQYHNFEIQSVSFSE